MIFSNGIFIWGGEERRTKRYGFFYACDSNYENNVTVNPTVDVALLETLKDKKVKITCKVVESRESGHLGDRFLIDEFDFIKPSKPEVGEEVVVGVGILDLMTDVSGAHECISFGLKPEDGRDLFWIDPRKLYRLHDQTVEFYIEETDEPFSPITTLKYKDSEGVISNGDGTYQYNGLKQDANVEMKILPNAIRLGEGLIGFQTPNAEGNPGEFYRVGE